MLNASVSFLFCCLVFCFVFSLYYQFVFFVIRTSMRCNIETCCLAKSLGAGISLDHTENELHKTTSATKAPKENKTTSMSTWREQDHHWAPPTPYYHLYALQFLPSQLSSHTNTHSWTKHESVHTFQFQIQFGNVYFLQHIIQNNSYCRLVLLLGLAALASGQLVDDFECPDEFAGFYPHLIRFVFSICLCISSPLSPPFSSFLPSVPSPLVVVFVVVDHTGWSSGGAGLLKMIIWRGRPLTNDHLERPASCKWSSVTPVTPVTLVNSVRNQIQSCGPF